MKTENVTTLTRLHIGHGSCSWRRCVILALVIVDEFFAGRFEGVCYYRTVLGNRWQIWE